MPADKPGKIPANATGETSTKDDGKTTPKPLTVEPAIAGSYIFPVDERLSELRGGVRPRKMGSPASEYCYSNKDV